MKLILFSAGTESTALLIDSIKKYGKENVIALTTIITDSVDNQYRKHYEATEFHTKKICKELDVEHILSYKNKVGSGYISYFGILQYVPDAYNLVLADRRITEMFSGVNISDKGNSIEDVKRFPHLSLARTLFQAVMDSYQLKIPWEYPLCTLSKKEQYDMIPEEIKSYVWTCDNFRKKTANGYLPCGMCAKCAEFRRM